MAFMRGHGQDDLVPGTRWFQRAAVALFAFILFVVVRRRKRRRSNATTARSTWNIAVSAAVPKSREAAHLFCSLFALWLAIAAAIALHKPWVFTWIRTSDITRLLSVLMLSVGITVAPDDFKASFERPWALILNFGMCFGTLPLLALGLAWASGLEGGLFSGFVLLGSVGGAQASNLCTLIAGGDVALSVLMTTSTTIACAFMTPPITKILLGAAVPINAWGMMLSTLQVVLVPICLGVGLNKTAPAQCKAAKPFTPVLGVIANVMIVGASVADCASAIASAGLPLHVAILALHAVGGCLGYAAAFALGWDRKTCRTFAIETTMKSGGFGVLLASLHFGAFDARVPSAVSLVWMSIMGSALAARWRGI